MTTEQVWQHALQFLDKYRLGLDDSDLSQLYQLPDGGSNQVLEGHRIALSSLFRDQQIDIKILYAELVRMLISEERQEAGDAKKYEASRAIGKIDGYQELTNRLQRILNQQFIIDIGRLKLERENNEMGTILQRLEELESTCGSMKEKSDVLEETNERLKREVEQLKGKLGSDSKITENDNYKIQKELIIKSKEEKFIKESNIHSEEKLSLLYHQTENQYETLAKLENQISTIMNQANILLINDAQQSDRLSCVEVKSNDCEAKLNDLESADLYLQQSHHMLSQRTEKIEQHMTGSGRIGGQSLRFPGYEQDSNLQTLPAESTEIEEDKVPPNKQSKSEDRLSASDDKVNQNLFILESEGCSYGQYPRDDTADNSQYDELKQKIEALEKKITDTSKERQITKEFHHRSEESKTLEKSTTVHKTTVVKQEEEVGHMKKIMQLMALQDKEATLQLLRMEQNLVEMQDNKNFFRFIEMVGGLDRSLNQMGEDMVEWQQLLSALKSQNRNLETGLEDQKVEVNRQGKVLQDQKEEVAKLIDNLEDIKKKEAIDFEQMDRRTEALENFLAPWKVRKKKGDKFIEVKKLSSSRTSLNCDEFESLLGRTDKPNKWLKNWFSKQNSGSLCC